jgi:hypothetical protein
MSYVPIVVSKTKLPGFFSFGGLSDFEPAERALIIESVVQRIERYTRDHKLGEARVTYHQGKTVKGPTYAADIIVVGVPPVAQQPQLATNQPKQGEQPTTEDVSNLEAKATSVTLISGSVRHNPITENDKKKFPSNIIARVEVHELLPQESYQDLVRIVQEELH